MNTGGRIGIVIGLLAVIGVTVALKQKAKTNGAATPRTQPASTTQPTDIGTALPRLVDLGAGKCIPCKRMAPILEELKKEYAGRMQVDFIDVWENPKAGEEYGVRMIPTQIFYDVAGKERFRHEGFFSREDILAKWKELGIDLRDKPAVVIERTEPAVADSRSKDRVCFLCDGDVDPKTRVQVKGEVEQVDLCSPHCFFIYYSSIKTPKSVEAKASVTDALTGKPIRLLDATYLYSISLEGRPTIAAYADRAGAAQEQRRDGGSLLDYASLRDKELAVRCGFCDRAVYPEDACVVTVEDATRTYGCCVMCGLGVAARLRKDIGLEAKDALTGDPVVLTTLTGSIAEVEPKSAVAWAGGRKGPDGNWASTGCFKQAFFASQANLETWLDEHPAATGRMVTMGQALASKMKMTPEQIAGACKLGECK